MSGVHLGCVWYSAAALVWMVCSGPPRLSVCCLRLQKPALRGAVVGPFEAVELNSSL
jgi:hypothetical protein